MRKALTVLAHLAAIVCLYLVVSGALFLGLQVNPAYGTVATLAAMALVGAYVYFGFIRKRRAGSRNTRRSPPQ